MNPVVNRLGHVRPSVSSLLETPFSCLFRIQARSLGLQKIACGCHVLPRLSFSLGGS